jgi:hypothetical protein
MHIIETGKDHVVIQQIEGEIKITPLNICTILFKQEVVLENNQKAKLVVVQEDDPCDLINERTHSSIRPSDRRFIHTDDKKFVQMQKIFVGFIQDYQAKEIELFPCRVIEIVPNGYL